MLTPTPLILGSHLPRAENTVEDLPKSFRRFIGAVLLLSVAAGGYYVLMKDSNAVSAGAPNTPDH